MKFKSGFIALVPDSNPEEHRCSLETSCYEFRARLVRNQQEAVAAGKELAEDAGIHSLILCPGFTHQQVAEISRSAGDDVGVVVARGDAPGSKIAREAIKEAGWGDVS